MNCPEIEPLWMDWLYEELTPETRTAFEEHLEQCESCRLEARRLRGTTHALESLRDDTSSAPLPRIWRRASERHASSRLWRAACAALFLIAAAGWVVAGRSLLEPPKAPAPRPEDPARLAAVEERLLRLEALEDLLAGETDRLDQALAAGLTRAQADARRSEQAWRREVERLQRDIRTLYTAELGSTD